MSKLKLASTIIIIALTVGVINFGDSSARETTQLERIKMSKDTTPNIVPVSFNQLGIMKASWYGPGFHGKLTANGELYNQMALTAAHKELPFGTYLRITNLRNGKSAIVRINDRGPYIEGRDLDLSKGTAIALGMVKRGVIKVKVEEIVVENVSVSTILN
ncbi:MAG: septal ring lytic transglycosylase RlpA family protein [Melioribacter sp.]|nr:septal ring lytic transglycosylase RlpA family protein [Melioribacter sp.]